MVGAGTRPDPLLVLVGTTASGKSAVAERLAVVFDAELVSTDALQVYRGLDIGTAKPSQATRSRIPHHCVDILDPIEECNAGRFARRARAALQSIRAAGRRAILVGGSGFYVQATLDGLDRLPASDPRWRHALDALRERRGAPWVHRILAAHDPVRAAQVAPQDGQRGGRSLEIVLRTGRPLAAAVSEASDRSLGRLDVPRTYVVLEWPSDALRMRIAERVNAMIERGWLNEVDALLGAGVPASCAAMQAIGYRQLAEVCRERESLETAVESIVTATYRYARRQRTWWRHRVQGLVIERQSGDLDTVVSRIAEHWRTFSPSVC